MAALEIDLKLMCNNICIRLWLSLCIGRVYGKASLNNYCHVMNVAIQCTTFISMHFVVNVAIQGMIFISYYIEHSK